MFFFSENEYFLPCSLFHYSYSKQSIQFVARSETNLLAITTSQGKRRKIKSIFPYFNQGEYSKYRKLKKIHLVYLNFVYLLICNASFQISVNFDIHLAFMCMMDHYFDFFFVPVCIFFSHSVFSFLRRFCLLFQESVQIFRRSKMHKLFHWHRSWNSHNISIHPGSRSYFYNSFY